MSSFDYRSLPPLPDSPVTAFTALPGAFVIPGTTHARKHSSSSHHFEQESRTNRESTDVHPNPSPQGQRQRSPHKLDLHHQARIPSSTSDNYRSTPFLLRSPSKHQSQSYLMPSTSVSPAKIPLPASPTRLSAQTLSPGAMGGLDESCIFPQSDGAGQNLSFSLIGDTSMPDMMSMEFDESLEFGSRPAKSRGNLLGRETAGAGQDANDTKGPSMMVSPAKVVLDDIGGTPARALSKAERTPLPSTSSRSSPSKADSTPQTSRPPTSSRSTRSPVKGPLTASRTKRTFPASSSNNMLSRLGEGEEGNIEAGDTSSLLPMSPVGMRHLMGDEHQLLRQSLPMSEGPSFFLPPLPPSSRKTPRAQAQRSPVKDADMTFDVNQLMARMAKPKRPSGTEESFVDLLHDSDLELDGMDGDETFLPADLRKRTKSLSSHIRSTSASVKAIDLPTAAPRTVEKPPLPQADSRERQRMREVERVATSGPSRAESNPRRHMTPGRSATERSGLSSPRRPESSPRRHMTPARSTAEAGPARLQSTRPAPTPNRMAQAPVSSRRISLSAGAVPLPTSASVSKMEIPIPPTSRHERTRSTVNTAEIVNRAAPSGLARPKSERDLTGRLPAPLSSRAVPTAAIPTSRPPALAVPREATSRPGSTRTGHPAVSGLGPPSRPAPPNARTAAPGTSSTARPASFRPTSMLGATAAKSSLPPTSARSMAPPAQTARPAVTRPSVPSSSRAFGADGAGQTNRLPTRPTTTSFKPSILNSGKMSMAPGASPSKRTTTSTLKSRAASTPAETVARTMVRPSTRAPASGLPSASSTSRTTTSGLPRPGASRLPTTSAGGGKMSAGPGSTSANLAALRARIDAASAKAASRKM